MYEVCNREGHRAGAAALAHLSIDACLDRKVCRVETGDDVRADWAEGIEGFATCELHVSALQVARGHIIEACVAEDVCERVFFGGELAASASDNDAKLASMLDSLGEFRQFDCFAVSDDGRGGFEEEEWLRRHRVAKFRGVLAV